jgi:hypothetical protein
MKLGPAAATLWALVACGARSGLDASDEPTSVASSDPALLDSPVELDGAPRTRPNPSVPLAPSTGDLPPGPTPELVPMPPGEDPIDLPLEPQPPPDLPLEPQPPPDPVAMPPIGTAEPPSLPTDMPVQPVPDGTVDTPDEDPPSPDAARLWLYFDDGAGRVVNLRDTRESFTVPQVVPAGVHLKPWSSDGRFLAFFEGTSLNFYDLSTGVLLLEDDTGTEMTVHGWVDGYGALISYYYEGDPLLYLGDSQGGFVVLAQTPEQSLVTRAASSPAGNAFVYATETNGQGRVHWVSIAGGVTSPIELLNDGNDALNQVRWSNDGQWVVFDDGPEGSFFAVHASDPPSRTEIGEASDLLEVSPTSDSALIADGSDLDFVGLLGPGEITHTPITDAMRGTEARYSSDGAFISYAESPNSGVLRSVATGSLTPEFLIEQFSEECPLFWLESARFVYQQCQSQDRGIVEGIVGADALSLFVHNETFRENMFVGPKLRCFVSFEADELDVGAASLPLVAEFTRTARANITFAALAPDDDAVAWMEGDDELFWLPLNDDCTVSTLPIAVTSDVVVRNVAFVAEFP